ncbi:MAG: hypothetical protein IH618_10450 [Ignavibacteriaceae bacterium]|nr:hypothetical protein [Ignavibacteriaceae bacterium]
MGKTELTNFAEDLDVRKIIGKYMRTINTMRELLSAISGEQHFKMKT